MSKVLRRDGLVAEYLLDRNAIDTAGTNNGTASNVTYAKTDRGFQSQCGVFNGTSSKVDTTYGGATNNFSISMVLTRGDSDGVAFSMYNSWCSIYSDGTVSASFYDGADRSISSSTGYVTDTKLHHLVWVKTSTNGQSLWLDGVKVAGNVTHNENLTTGYTASPGIGYFRTFNAHYTSGNIQSVRIFNRALSASEITDWYEESLRYTNGSSLTGLMDGLVAYHDSSDGNELSDIVGGKDATKVSGTATTDNLGNTRAISNPNYTFPSITYSNVYSFENSGAGWGLVANPVGITAVSIVRTTTFRFALYFNRALSATEQSAIANIASQGYPLPFGLNSYEPKTLPKELKEGCVLYLDGSSGFNGTRLQENSLYNDANLVRYYTMDDLTEKNGNTLTNSGATSVTGKFGTAYNSTGTSNLYNATATGITNGACTISCWAKVNGSHPGTDHPMIAMVANETTDVAYGIGFNQTNTQIRFSRLKQQIAWQDATYSFTPAVGEWNHYALTYNGTTVVGYLNGAQVATVSASGNGSGTTPEGIQILARGYAPAGDFFNGGADDVAVFSRALSASEIASIYGQSLAFDASGLNNHGTLVNAPAKNRRSGHMGWELNGSNQYVVRDVPSMTGSFSLALTVKSNNMNGGSGVMVGMVKTTPSENTEHYLFAGNGTDSYRCAFLAYDGAFRSIQASPRWNTSSIYRILISFDSSTKKMSMYVNGKLNGTFTTTNQITSFDRIYVGLARPPFEYCHMDFGNFTYHTRALSTTEALLDSETFFIPSL